MPVTDFARREEAAFAQELEQAHTAAEAVLADPTAGPWTYSGFITTVMEASGVRHDLARCAEDQLICDRQLRSLGSKVIRFESQ